MAEHDAAALAELAFCIGGLLAYYAALALVWEWRTRRSRKARAR